MWIKSAKLRVLLALLVFCGALLVAAPTLEMLFTGKEKEALSLRYRDPIKLGLDLKGGVYLEMEVLVDRAVEYEMDRLKGNIVDFLGGEDIDKDSLTVERVEGQPLHLRLKVPSASADKAAQLITEKYTVLKTHSRSTEGAFNVFDLEWMETEVAARKSEAVDQAIETIRNRIDEFGVAEPSITRQGANRIIVQLPGETNPDRIKGVINRTAFLEFKLVDNKASIDAFVPEIIKKADETRLALGENFDQRTFLDTVNKAFEDKLPKGTRLYFERDDILNPTTKQIEKVRWTPYVLEEGTLLTGAAISDARVAYDSQFGAPYCSMNFNPEGAVQFEQLTGANVGRNMAIVLDGVIHSAPVIRSKIAGGRAMIEGQFTPEQARDLAIVLRSGSLPAEVKTLRQSVVGPGLGKDSIKSGIKAVTYGSLMVVVLLLFLYRFLGVIALLSQLVNLILVLAFMLWLGATLTLPGIAGFALTVVMAVDGNILIFERIRDEVNAGKRSAAALALGFDRAFITILDSNVATFIAGVVLFQYGTGPIKGFAATLCLGIVSSVFSAVFVTRSLILLWTEVLKFKLEITGGKASEAPTATAGVQS